MMDDDDLWDESGGIVGPWPTRAQAEAALLRAIELLGHTWLAVHARGDGIARVYDLGGTGWIAAECDLLIALAGALAQPTLIGVEVTAGEASVTAYELHVVDGAIYRGDPLGRHADARDPLDARLGWEQTYAARAVGLDGEDAASHMTFYRERAPVDDELV